MVDVQTEMTKALHHIWSTSEALDDDYFYQRPWEHVYPGYRDLQYEMTWKTGSLLITYLIAQMFGRQRTAIKEKDFATVSVLTEEIAHLKRLRESFRSYAPTGDEHE